MERGRKVERRRQPGWPFLVVLIGLVVLLVALVTGAVGYQSYDSTNTVADEFWSKLSRRIASETVQRALAYLEGAEPFLKYSRDRMKSGNFGTAANRDEEELLKHLYTSLDAYPNVTWFSWGDKNGTYLSVYRRDGAVHRTWREIDGKKADGKPNTLYRDYIRIEDSPAKVAGTDERSRGDARAPRTEEDHWVLLKEHRTAWGYDPRVRPWYVGVQKSDKGMWQDPFIFMSLQQPGFTFSGRQTLDGKLVGVWAVDFEARYLSDFLATLEIGKTGRAYVITRDGDVVAHPRSETGEIVNGDSRIAHAATHPDRMLRLAWTELQQRELQRLDAEPDQRVEFDFGDYIAMAQAFPTESEIEWVVLMVAPKEDIFGHVRAQVRFAIFFGVGALVLAAGIGVYISRRLSRSLRDLSDEMERIALFRLTDVRFEDSPTLIREINEMGAAADNMKRGLHSFGKYVPYRLVRRLMRTAGHAELGGEVRELTVLFADIAGFTTYAEQADTDAVVETLGEYLEEMVAGVHETSGTVDKYLGDAIMAFWGAPDEQADHALLACRAALDIRRRLGDLCESRLLKAKPLLRGRIGVNTGEMLVGNVGSSERLNYTVIGDAVNVASRLEALNKVFNTEILVGEGTARYCFRDESLVFRRLQRVALKGKEEPLEIYELVGDADTVIAQTRKAIESYETGLKRFWNRDFGGATRHFESAEEEFGGFDWPSHRLIELCQHHLKQAPSEDWDGGLRMTTK